MTFPLLPRLLPSHSEFNFDPDEHDLFCLHLAEYVHRFEWERKMHYPEKPAGDRPGCLRSSQEDPRRRWRWRSEPSLAASHLFGDREDFWQKQFKSIRHQERGMMSNPDHRTFFGFRNQSDFTALFSHPSSIRSNGRIPVFHIFRQSRVELQQGRSQFVRATGAGSLASSNQQPETRPGEKAHFVVDSGATYDQALINQVRNDPSGRLKSMLDIPLVKGQEIPVVAKFFTDYTQPGSDPVTVVTTTVRDLAGPNWKTNDSGNILPGPGGTPSPRGITIYLASGSNLFRNQEIQQKFQYRGWERHLRLRQCGCGLELEPLYEFIGQQSPYEWIQAPLEITGRLGQDCFS